MNSHVIIIGGGAIGLCTAYYLSKSGAQVTVIDKGEFGQGSSWANAGYVCPSHFIPLASPGIISQGLKWMLSPASPFYVKPRLDGEFISWAWKFRNSCTAENVQRAMPLLRDLGNVSLQLYKEFAMMGAFDFEWTTRGLLTLYRTDGGKKHCEEEAEHAHHLGIAAKLLNKHELQQLEPNVEMRADGGLLFPDDCHLTPAKFVEGLAKYLEANGVKLLKNTAVSGFKVQGNRIAEVTTSNGAIKADEVVLAGGSWSSSIVRSLGITLPMQAGKGYSITYEQKNNKPRIPFILTEARVAVTPMGNAMRFAGTMEIAGLNLSITQRRVDAILQSLKHYFGGFDNLRAQDGEVWAGLRPVSPDGLPYVGRFRAFSNLIAATGHAMIGMSLAPITGKLVTDIVANVKPSNDLTLLEPERFS